MIVGIIFEHFGPYHIARINAAGGLVDVEAIELLGSCEHYPWSSTAQLSNKHVAIPADSGVASAKDIARRVEAILNSLQLDALVVHGWSMSGAVAAMRWAVRHNVPIIVMSESNFGGMARRVWKEWPKKRLLGNVSAAIVGAESHADYLVSLGIKRASISFGYNAVDNDFFAKSAREAQANRESLRESLQLPERYFFSSNRFIEKKNLAELLKAYQTYLSKAELPWDLVLAGAGPLEGSLKSLAVELGIQQHVKFPGFLDYQASGQYFGLAAGFVHVSTMEQWGLVVNEAAAAGLPLIVSRQCGCASHLLRHGQNGFACDAFDTDSIANALLDLSAASPESREAMGQLSEQIVSQYSPEQFAIGIKQAASYAIENHAKGSWLDRMILRTISGLNIVGRSGL